MLSGHSMMIRTRRSAAGPGEIPSETLRARRVPQNTTEPQEQCVVQFFSGSPQLYTLPSWRTLLGTECETLLYRVSVVS